MTARFSLVAKSRTSGSGIFWFALPDPEQLRHRALKPAKIRQLVMGIAHRHKDVPYTVINFHTSLHHSPESLFRFHGERLQHMPMHLRYRLQTQRDNS